MTRAPADAARAMASRAAVVVAATPTPAAAAAAAATTPKGALALARVGPIQTTFASVAARKAIGPNIAVGS